MSSNKKYLGGKQTVQSMRSSGYKSTDYAVAELIDNSIQADATDIVIAVLERTTKVQRKTSKAHEIWVLDNGKGMDPGLAEDAVTFGGSDRFDDRGGMGRFGMGLPQSSVSQCKRTDVWTWQDSDPRDAVTVRLDLDEIEAGVDAVPSALKPGDADYQPLPDWVLDIYENHMERTVAGGQEATPSGTAIRWSTLDRVRWVRGDTIVEHVEFLLGRIYRRFLTGDAAHPETGKSVKARIHILVVQQEDMEKGAADLTPQRILPNNPMHTAIAKNDVLRYFEKGNPAYAPNAPKSDNVNDDGTPIEPLVRVEDEAPFGQFHPPKTFSVRSFQDGKNHDVVIRTARVTSDGRPATVRNAGSDTHQGRHAARNRGVSIMRADREVCMDETYYYDAPDRWWSVEVSFPPALDEIFGVTNNKQDVPYFKELCRQVARRAEGSIVPAAEDVSMLDAGDIDAEHGYVDLEDVAQYVLSQVRLMRNENLSEHASRRSNAKKRVGKAASPTVHTTLKVKKELSQVEPTPGETKVGQERESQSPEEQEKALQERMDKFRDDAIQQGVTPDDAEAATQNYMKGLDYQPIEVQQSAAPAFFWPDEYGDFEVVYINTAHPAHTDLLDVLRLEDEKVAALTEEEAKLLLGQAADALGWMIHGWARMEILHKDTPAHKDIADAREKWGKQLKMMVESKSFQEARKELEAIMGDEDDEE